MSNFVLSVYSIWLHTVYVILTLSILILLFFSSKEHKVYLPWSKKQPWIIQKYLYFHFNIWGAYVLIWLKNIIRNEIFVVQYDCKWDFAWLLLAIECQRYFHWFNEPASFQISNECKSFSSYLQVNMMLLTSTYANIS